MINDLLVIKVNVDLSKEEFEELRRSLVEQKTSGTVVLPQWCEAILVPKEIGMKIGRICM